MIYICFYFFVILYYGPKVFKPCNLGYNMISNFHLQGRPTSPFAEATIPYGPSCFYIGENYTLLRLTSKSLASRLILLSTHQARLNHLRKAYISMLTLRCVPPVHPKLK